MLINIHVQLKKLEILQTTLCHKQTVFLPLLLSCTEPDLETFKEPEIDFKESIPPAYSI